MLKRRNDARHLYKSGFKQTRGVRYLEGKELKKFQDYLLSILKDFIEVTQKYGLNYSLGGGSVLGAIRHGGFIPWDDDIDINMPRKDFEKLRRIFDSELGDRYTFCTPEDGKGHGLAHSQIKRKGTIYRSFNELSKPEDQCGIGIDVFVADNVPDNLILRCVHEMLCLFIGFMLTCRKTYEDYHYIVKYLPKANRAKRAFFIKYCMGTIVSLIPLDSLAYFTDRCYGLYKDDRSKYVSFISGRKHYRGEMYRRTDLCRFVKKDFEGIVVNIPIGYKTYCKKLFGYDYLELPPENERESHPLMELRYNV